MTLFWFFAAALMALALALVLPALLRTTRVAGQGPARAGLVQTNRSILRDQLAQLDAEHAAGAIDAAQLAQARDEIERRALEEEGGGGDPAISRAGAAGHIAHGAMAGHPGTAVRSTGVAWLLGLGVPTLALGLYGFLGNPQALLSGEQAAAPAGGEVTTAQIEAMVDQMAQRLQSQPPDQPADPMAWEMLARSYAALSRFPEADKAYARAVQLAPDNAQLLADHADVLTMLQGRSAAGEPTRLIARALQLDPRNLKALALAGSAAFERKDFAAATRYWTQARQLAPPGSDFAGGLERSLEAARAEDRTAPADSASTAGRPGNASSMTGQTLSTVTSGANGANGASSQAGTGSTSSMNNASGGGVSAMSAMSGVVSLAPALAGRVAPDDTVFIFARAADGPRMPLAVLRHKASELPIAFKLDDSTAMSSELRLSKFAQVVVSARISRSGNATAQSGDLAGQSGPLKNVAQGLVITIDSVQP